MPVTPGYYQTYGIRLTRGRFLDGRDLAGAPRVAIRSVVGNTTIEEVLTTGRAQAQEYATGYIQTLMDQYESGLLITEVKLQVVDGYGGAPPLPVHACKKRVRLAEAMHDNVIRLRAERDRLMRELHERHPHGR